MSLITADELTMRYGKVWALRECSFSLPPNRVVALVGPNGAGKTTLLHTAVGLLAPTSGRIEVLGRSARDDVLGVLARVGFVAQDRPLYRGLSVADTLELGRRLNARWDGQFARERLRDAGIALERTVGALSLGQQAQVSLTLALGKRPEVLLLDEPLAGLDPLARRAFLQELMEAVAREGTSVVISSHVVSELERVCDYLLVLVAGGVQLVGSIDELLARHSVVTASRDHEALVARQTAIVDIERAERQFSALVRMETDGLVARNGVEVRAASFEDLVLGYLKQPETEGATGGVR